MVFMGFNIQIARYMSLSEWEGSVCARQKYLCRNFGRKWEEGLMHKGGVWVGFHSNIQLNEEVGFIVSFAR